MSFIDMLKQRAMAVNGTIVLPESGDERTLRAAAQILCEGLAKVILIGKEEDIHNQAGALELDLAGAQIIDPEKYSRTDEFAEFFHEKRKEKGVRLEQAHHTVRTELFFGALCVKFGIADGMVAGAANTTAAVLRAALQVVGVLPGLKTVSSTYFMVVSDFMGEDRVFLFADCAVVPNPTSEQLADIAISTALTRKAILGDEPKVALLSFSTKGSAEHELVDKVRVAGSILHQRKVDFAFDSELQLDAAIVPAIAQRKAPQSILAGNANTLIFPDLQAGNIGCKLVHIMAKAEAIGPIIQGLAAPICDLSRGCSSQDIVNTSVLVLLMVDK
ncbi:MAG: phosphate acetyltransferase [Candidatus Cloacimonadaceae bacterium]|nr:phosphate acetyltransferase [Candidatus Cloacimonadaceae bacterium]